MFSNVGGGVCDAMPCNTMQNVGLEREQREVEVKKGCDLSICRGLLSCRVRYAELHSRLCMWGRSLLRDKYEHQ